MASFPLEDCLRGARPASLPCTQSVKSAESERSRPVNSLRRIAPVSLTGGKASPLVASRDQPGFRFSDEQRKACPIAATIVAMMTWNQDLSLDIEPHSPAAART